MISESEVAQLCPTIRDPMDCSLPGSSVHGSFQARVLEWVASAFSTNDLITSISKLQGEKNLYLFANSEQIPCLDPFHS